jgi:2-iminoacetate synthase
MMRNMTNNTFIDEEKINTLLKISEIPDDYQVKDILDKALQLKGLEMEDAAVLLNINKPGQLDNLYNTALKIKNEIYGNRLVLFAPLYISNYCSNNCLYCGFRMDNKDIERKTLSMDEIKDETRLILEQGHKRVLLLSGEHHKNCTFDYFLESIDAIYNVKDDKGSSVRRINVEIAPLADEELRRLSQVKIGTYTVFQETYHKETYLKMHPTGIKHDYEWRVNVMDRALQNGLHDVGIGALFGLYDYRFEVLGLIQHSIHLDKTFNVGPHTISIPRINPAKNAPYSLDIPHQVTDENFKKLIAILRCSVPYTGMILSTRESSELRSEIFNLGISQISAGSRTNPGGYKQSADLTTEDGQFSLNDCRTSGEVIRDVIEQGFIPSFCTGCYRLGRVGEDFMDMAKPGLIKLHCLPNAITTLKEYLVDYADDETKKLGEELILKEIDNIPTENRQKTTKLFLNRIEEGERDLYF